MSTSTNLPQSPSMGQNPPGGGNLPPAGNLPPDNQNISPEIMAALRAARLRMLDIEVATKRLLAGEITWKEYRRNTNDPLLFNALYRAGFDVLAVYRYMENSDGAK